jgi:histidine triad (HIT) family protein
MTETPQCPFCMIKEGTLPTSKVFEDGEFIGAMEIRPANAGHVVLFPKDHFKTLQDLPDDLRDRFLSTAGMIAKALTQISEGVNILLSSDQAAGQALEHISLHIIPRFKDDKIVFAWNPKQVEEGQMKELTEAVTNAIGAINVPKKVEVKEVAEETNTNYEDLEKELTKPEERKI